MRSVFTLAVVAVGLSSCATSDGSSPRTQAAAPQQAEPAAPSPARPAVECLGLIEQGVTAIRRSPQGATTDWRVQLRNLCPQPTLALVELWVLDRNNTAIGYEAQRVAGPGNAAFEARGQITVPHPQSATIAATIVRYGAEATQPPPSAPIAAPARPAPIAAPAQPATSGPPRSADIDMTVGVMNWQGNVAVTPVEFANGTGAPSPQFDVTCEFVAAGQILGTDRQRVRALMPGERTIITVSADVGGQLIDQVRCAG